MKARHAAAGIEAALRDTPVVFIQGPRQAGKSTLVETLCAKQGRHYLTLDDAAVLNAAHTDAEGFVRGLPDSVALDEVQRVPALFRAIKLSVDQNRRPGRFLLTGSTSALALPLLSDSLAGRVEVRDLLPFSQGEVEGSRETFIDKCFGESFRTHSPKASRPKAGSDGGWKALAERIVFGGYPEVLVRQEPRRRRAWFASYVTTILQRDVRDLAHVTALSELPKLLSLAAARVTGLLNFADLARDAAMPRTSLQRYWSLLEATFLVNTLPAWTTNLGSRLIKSPKVLVNDTGLCCHLLGRGDLVSRADDPLTGALLETFVATELLKQTGWADTPARLHHYRAHSQHEVDIVLEDDAGHVVGVEVKKTASPNASHFTGMKHLREQAGTRFRRGVLLYTGVERVAFGDELWATPVSDLWHG